MALEQDYETALEISDRARRHRFFSSLGYGGRLESLRWTLEAPETELDQLARLQRKNLLGAFPAYETLSRQANSCASSSRPCRWCPATMPASRSKAGAGPTGRHRHDQEAILREIALRHEAASLRLSAAEVHQGDQARRRKGRRCCRSSSPTAHLRLPDE